MADESSEKWKGWVLGIVGTVVAALLVTVLKPVVECRNARSGVYTAVMVILG